MTLKFGKLALGALVASGLTLPLGATSIGVGTFDLSGRLEVTQTTVTFGLQSPPATPNNQTALVIDGSGSFSGLSAGQMATIKNINSMPAFPSGALSIPQWIVLPDGIDLDLSTAVINTALPLCSTTGASDVVGTTCRVNAQSPITLTQNATGVRAGLSLLGTAYSGTSNTGTSSFVGLLSADFTQAGETTISSLLTTFASANPPHVDTGYEANFTVSIVPEPGMLAGLGLGMLVLGSLRKKIRGNKA
jgi:hypothetical protein